MLGSAGLVVISLLILVGGSRLLVTGATSLAQLFGVSQTLIGLTIVAAGTSLPEVATSIMATVRGQSDLAVGNVMGSNIFNIILILGLSAIANNGITVSETILNLDFLVLLGLTFLCFPLLVTAKKLVRWEGAVLLLGYALYTAALIYRG